MIHRVVPDLAHAPLWPTLWFGYPDQTSPLFFFFCTFTNSFSFIWIFFSLENPTVLLNSTPIISSLKRRCVFSWRWPVSYCRELNSYSIPFLGADVSVVKQTQRYLRENLEQSPVQYAAYVTMGGVTSIIKTMFAGLFFIILCEVWHWKATSCKGGVGNTHLVPVFKQPRIYSADKTWIHPKETHDNVVEASGSEKTEEEAPARENEEEEGSPNNKVEEEATTSGNNQEESPASDRAEQEAQTAPKVDGMDDESQSVVESMSSRQDEEAAESCFGNLGSCFRSLRAILFFTTLAGIIPWWPHNRVYPANEPDEATLDDVVEAGGSEKT
ncbi:uncharacterized protein LOC100521600 isoform X3 [Sus scrofa]|uniref:uncharacterized protein LOC100521600 isoform X3 n=1 Tax=Sus scrofa TaxID=9823 RepID=UPI000A2B0774|nr:uncharacterized protein LOC100521600 isoform X3 [Sus scrofa]